MTDRDPRNSLLAALPAEDYWAFSGDLTTITVRAGETITIPVEPVPYVYFVDHGAVSLLLLMEQGMTAEAAFISSEGMIGFPRALADSSWQAVALMRTELQAMELAVFSAQLERLPVLRAVLDRYLAMLLGLSAQLAGCSHFHTLPSRVARLLMLAAERSSGEVHLSHEVIARVLGAQRPSVSLTLERMRDEGLLSYRRADIRIQDAAGLRALSCACYIRFRQSLDTLRTALTRHSR